MAPIVVEQIYASPHRLRQAGTALLIVEQHVGHALRLCDRVALLDDGSVSWIGTSADVGPRVRT